MGDMSEQRLADLQAIALDAHAGSKNPQEDRAQKLLRIAQEAAGATQQPQQPQEAPRDITLVDGDSGYYNDDRNDSFRVAHGNTPEKSHQRRVDASPNAQLAQDTMQRMVDEGATPYSEGKDDTYGRGLTAFRDERGNDVTLDLVRAGLAHPTQTEESAAAYYEGISRRALGLAPTHRKATNEAAEHIVPETVDFSTLAVAGNKPRDYRNAWSKSFARGVDEVQASFGGLFNYVGEMTGNKDLAQYGREVAVGNELEASFSPREIESYEQIKTPFQAMTYVIETAGEITPELVVDGLMTLATMGAGLSIAAGRRVVTGAVSRAVSAGTITSARGDALKYSLMAGPTISGAAQSAGAMENRLDAEDDGVHTLESSLSGIVGGAMNLAAYAAVFGDIARAAGLDDGVTKAVTEGLTGWGKARAAAGNSARVAAKGGAVEGSASLAQMVIDDVIYSNSLNKDWDDITTNYVDETIRAVLGGGLAAGGSAGVAHGASVMREYSANKRAAEDEIAARSAPSEEENAAFEAFYAAQIENDGAVAAQAKDAGDLDAKKSAKFIVRDGELATPEQVQVMMDNGIIDDSDLSAFLRFNGVSEASIPNKSDATPEEMQTVKFTERGNSILKALHGDVQQAVDDGHLTQEAADKIEAAKTDDPEKAAMLATKLTALMLKSQNPKTDRAQLRKDYLTLFQAAYIKRSDIFASAVPEKDMLQGYKNFVLKQKEPAINEGSAPVDEAALARNNAEADADTQAEREAFDARTKEVREMGDATIANMSKRVEAATDPLLKSAFEKIIADVNIDVTRKGHEKLLDAAEAEYEIDNRNLPPEVRRLALVEAADERMRDFGNLAKQEEAVKQRARVREVEPAPAPVVGAPAPVDTLKEKGLRSRFLSQTNKRIKEIEDAGEAGSDEHKELLIARDRVEAINKSRIAPVQHSKPTVVRKEAPVEKAPEPTPKREMVTVNGRLKMEPLPKSARAKAKAARARAQLVLEAKQKEAIAAKEASDNPTKTKRPSAQEVGTIRDTVNAKALTALDVVESAAGQYTPQFTQLLSDNKVKNTGHFATDALKLRKKMGDKVINMETPAPTMAGTQKVVGAKEAKAAVERKASEAWSKSQEGEALVSDIAKLEAGAKVGRKLIAEANAKGLKEINGKPIIKVAEAVHLANVKLAELKKLEAKGRKAFITDFMEGRHGSLDDIDTNEVSSTGEVDLIDERDSMEETAKDSVDALAPTDAFTTPTEIRTSMKQRFARARAAVTQLQNLFEPPKEGAEATLSPMFAELQDHLTKASDLETGELGAEFVAEQRADTTRATDVEILFDDAQEVNTATAKGSRLMNTGIRLSKKAREELHGLMVDAYTAEFNGKENGYAKVESFLRARGIIKDDPIVGKVRGDDPQSLVDNAIQRTISRRSAAKKNNVPDGGVGTVPITIVGEDGSKVLHHIFADEIAQMGLLVQGRRRDDLSRDGGVHGKRRADIFEAFLDGLATFANANGTVGKIDRRTVIWRDSGRANNATAQKEAIAKARADKVTSLVSFGMAEAEAVKTVRGMKDSEFHPKLSDDVSQTVAAPITYAQAAGAYNATKGNIDRIRLSRGALEAILADVNETLMSGSERDAKGDKRKGAQRNITKSADAIDAEVQRLQRMGPKRDAPQLQLVTSGLSVVENTGAIEKYGNQGTKDFEALAREVKAIVEEELDGKGDITPEAQLLIEEYREAKKDMQGEGDIDHNDNKDVQDLDATFHKPEWDEEADYVGNVDLVTDRMRGLSADKTEKQITSAREQEQTARDRVAALEAERDALNKTKAAKDGDKGAKAKRLKDIGAEIKRLKKRVLEHKRQADELDTNRLYMEQLNIIKGQAKQPKGQVARSAAKLRSSVTPVRVVKGLAKLTHTLRTRLERIHPTVADMLFSRTGEDKGKPNFERDARFMREEHESAWAKVMRGADAATIKAAWQDARTGEPTTPLGKEAMRVITAFTSEIASKNPNYKATGSPLVIDTANLNKDRVGFKAVLERAGVKMPKGMSMDDLIDMLLDSKGVVEHAVRPEMPHVTGGRGFAEMLRPAVKLLEEGHFLVDDGETTMARFFASGAAYATWAQIFGAKNSKGEFNENAKYQYYMAQVPPAYLGEFRKLVAGVTGQQSHNTPAWLNRLNAASFVLTASTVLLFSGVASIPEIGVAVGRTRGDIDGVAQDIVTHLQGTTRRQRDDVAELFGTITPSMVSESMTATYDNGLLTVGKFGQKVTQTVFKYNGQEFVTRMTRSLSTHWGIKFLEQHGRLAAKGDKTSIRLLKELRMTHKDVETFENERMINGGNPNLETDAGKKYATALRLFVDEAVSNPHAGQMPLWMSDPRFSILSSLKKFFYAFWDNYHRSVYGEMKKRHGEGMRAMDVAMPLVLSAAIMLPLASIAEMLRELWKYPQTFFPFLPDAMGRKAPRTAGEIATGIAQATGGLGVMQLAASVHEQAGHGRNFAVAAAGPTASFAHELLSGEVLTENPSRILGPINQTPWVSKPVNKTWKEWIKGDDY